MTYKGTIRNGVIVLEEGVILPEGAEVRVEAMEDAKAMSTLAERFADIIGGTEGLPEDLAENHDHYLHGTSKKST